MAEGRSQATKVLAIPATCRLLPPATRFLPLALQLTQSVAVIVHWFPMMTFTVPVMSILILIVVAFAGSPA